MSELPSFEDRRIRKGDIIVTAVAQRYAIGRMTADGKTQEPLGAQPTLDEALEQACALAGTMHRVFLYARAGKNTYVVFHCPALSAPVAKEGG